MLVDFFIRFLVIRHGSIYLRDVRAPRRLDRSSSRSSSSSPPLSSASSSTRTPPWPRPCAPWSRRSSFSECFAPISCGPQRRLTGSSLSTRRCTSPRPFATGSTATAVRRKRRIWTSAISPVPARLRLKRRTHHRHVVARQLAGVGLAEQHGRRGTLSEHQSHGALLGVAVRALLKHRLNLCAEGSYSKPAIKCFGGRNTHYCIEDHNPCSMGAGACGM